MLRYPKSTDDLQNYLSLGPIIAIGGRTSTVNHFHRMQTASPDLQLLDFSKWPKSMEFGKDHVTVSGPVTWQDLMEEARSIGLDVPVYPTETTATVLGGVSTSATGERSYGYGPLRRHILALNAMDGTGKIHTIEKKTDRSLHADYRNELERFANFKNAPFLNLTTDLDCWIGHEGQFGVITQVTLALVPLELTRYLMVHLPSWRKDVSEHLELHRVFSAYRETHLQALEFSDAKSFSFVEREFQINKEDVLFIEVRGSKFDDFIESCPQLLNLGDRVQELSQKDYRAIRKAIPRSIFESIERKGQHKIGTDIQVAMTDFDKLLEHYQSCPIENTLFGHFGDQHLHLYLTPGDADLAAAQSYMNELYQACHSWHCSPFAEHGIGEYKKRYAPQFWNKAIESELLRAKEEFDPQWKCFPGGPLSSIR